MPYLFIITFTVLKFLLVFMLLVFGNVFYKMSQMFSKFFFIVY